MLRHRVPGQQSRIAKPGFRSLASLECLVLRIASIDKEAHVACLVPSATKHGRSAYTIHEWHEALTDLKLPAASRPTLTAMVGKRAKTEAMRGLISSPHKLVASGHGQAFLLADIAPKAEGPIVYLDYELQSCDLPKWQDGRGNGSRISRTVDLLANGSQPWSRRRVGDIFCGRAIAPLCDTICYFAADLGGLRVVASLLAEIISEDAAVDLPQACLPRVVVVVDTMSKHFDSNLTELRLLDELSERLSTGQDVASRLQMHFHSLRVVGSSKRAGPRERWSQLRRRICAIKRDMLTARTLYGLGFQRDHLFAIGTKLFDHHSRDSSGPFSFVTASRSRGFSNDHRIDHAPACQSLALAPGGAALVFINPDGKLSSRIPS